MNNVLLPVASLRGTAVGPALWFTAAWSMVVVSLGGGGSAAATPFYSEV
jgi:hypothetical protein